MSASTASEHTDTPPFVTVRVLLTRKEYGGHEFTEANTIWKTSGGRDCRACARIRNARYKAKKAMV